MPAIVGVLAAVGVATGLVIGAFAPLVIGVVHVPRDNPKIPQWEMFLSGGAAAMNLVSDVAVRL